MAIISGGNIMPSSAAGKPTNKAGVLVANDYAPVIGRRAVDTSIGKLYICTATNGTTTTTTWTIVGAQTGPS